VGMLCRRHDDSWLDTAEVDTDTSVEPHLAHPSSWLTTATLDIDRSRDAQLVDHHSSDVEHREPSKRSCRTSSYAARARSYAQIDRHSASSSRTVRMKWAVQHDARGYGPRPRLCGQLSSGLSSSFTSKLRSALFTAGLLVGVVLIVQHLLVLNRARRQPITQPIPSPSFPPAVPLDAPQRPPPPPSPPAPSVCACRNPPGSPGHTLREPPAVAASAADVCFDAEVEGLLDPSDGSMYALRCFIPLMDGSTSSRSTAAACVSPRRAYAGQRALVLLGDSHCVALKTGMERALRGRMAFGFAAVPACPFHADGDACFDANFVLATLGAYLEPHDLS